MKVPPTSSNIVPDLQNPAFELSAYFEITPDLVCIASKEGYFKKVNPAVINLLEYTEEELFARPINTFIYQEDKAETQRTREELLKGEMLLNFTNRYITKSGKIVWLEWTSIYFAENQIVFAIAKNITKRKIIENEIEEKYNKFKSLATHFKKSIEKDRKFLAYELHEELAQLASAVKMELDMIPISVANLTEAARSKIEHAGMMAELLMKTIQRISFSISPAMLDEFGLNATLEWLCKEFAVLNGIPCFFESDYDDHGLSHEIKTDFFRICQESLTNAMYHAQASNVYISIKEIDNKIILCIADDGKGFDINQQKKTAGLISMRELATSINCELTIQSEIGKGTIVSVAVQK